ncbi:MAG: large conductance mechanosensitive channel protein MscL [Clostridia bacterium]|nr:large conductance mechanosensitive channel protein MscL [Clostridia bacterium]
MKKFFGEFKKFITRGNVLDMAVGVIVGGAFTAIVNGLSNFILKPIINWLLALVLGKDSLSEVYTFLGAPTYLEDGTIDLANSIYIDWGSFINAIINFFLIAIVLFTIVRAFNRIKERNEQAKKEWAENVPSKEDRKEMKKQGISLRDEEAIAKFMADKKAKAEEELKKAEEQAKIDAENAAKNSTEGLLKQILAELQAKK